MIISASRRTDIPAFCMPWFMKRLGEGYVTVKNPYNPNMVSRVSLAPGDVDCIVFWTRDPRPLLECWASFERFGIPCYVQFTITGYGRDLEPNLPPKEEALSSFIALSRLLGPERVIWRYDPVIFTGAMDGAFHLRCFTALASRLEGYTTTCIMSFITMYTKCRRRLSGFEVIEPDADLKLATAAALQTAAVRYGMELRACAENTPLDGTGVRPAACIDGGLIRRITGRDPVLKKDSGQRKGCGCVKSTDIGTYDTCLHGCRYCYAVASDERARRMH